MQIRIDSAMAAAAGAPHLDSANLLLFEEQLRHVATEVTETEYPDVKFEEQFPLEPGISPFKQEYVWYELDRAGMAVLIRDYADDLPLVGSWKRKNTSPIESLGNGYQYSIDEVGALREAGMSLDGDRAQLAKEFVMRKHHSLAWNGDASANIPGFLLNANVPSSAVDNDGVGASRLWSKKTPAQIYRDMHDLVQGQRDATKQMQVPNTLLLPPAKLGLIQTTRFSDSSDLTILEYFAKAHPYIQNIDWSLELEGAGPAGEDMMVCYRRDRTVLARINPVVFEQLPPQAVNLAFKVPCRGKSGGVIIKRPLGVRKAYGI